MKTGFKLLLILLLILTAAGIQAQDIRETLIKLRDMYYEWDRLITYYKATPFKTVLKEDEFLHQMYIAAEYSRDLVPMLIDSEDEDMEAAGKKLKKAYADIEKSKSDTSIVKLRYRIGSIICALAKKLRVVAK
ncbi:MAG: hypothetical protein JW969_11505 [Spirochaetales bacterium]|nr:hypothetical protein [Spirochaetales bacterium]